MDTIPQALHVNPENILNIFGSYGGLGGLVIGGLFLLLVLVAVISLFGNRILAKAIAAQGDKLSDSIATQTGHFVNTLQSIREAHNSDRDKMLDMIERLTSPATARANVARPTQSVVRRIARG